MKGECVYKTFNTGYTNTFTIPIPKGSYIILRQIIYYPFIYNNNFNTDLDILQRTCVQLSMNELGANNELLYIFRNNLQSGQSLLGDIFSPGEPQNIETWKVFKKPVVIDIGFGTNAANALYLAPSTFVPQANERITPLGYDTITIPSQVLINGVTKSLYPTGEQREFNIPFQAGNEDRLRYDFNNDSRVPDVNAFFIENAIGYGFPLFTFGYFEFQTAKSINLQ